MAALSAATNAVRLLIVSTRVLLLPLPPLHAVCSTQRVAPATPAQMRPLPAAKQAATSPADTTEPRDVCSAQALPASAAAGLGPVPVAVGKSIAAALPAADGIGMSKHAPPPAAPSDSASSCIRNGSDGVAAKVSMLEGAQVPRRVAIA